MAHSNIAITNANTEHIEPVSGAHTGLSLPNLDCLLGGQTPPIPIVLRVRVKHQASGVVGHQYKPAPRNFCSIDIAQFEESAFRPGRIQFVPDELWWFCFLCRVRPILHVNKREIFALSGKHSNDPDFQFRLRRHRFRGFACARIDARYLIWSRQGRRPSSVVNLLGNGIQRIPRYVQARFAK